MFFFAKSNKALATLCNGDYQKARELYTEYFSTIEKGDDDIDGAKQDLLDLIEKGQFVEESKTILKDYF